MDFIKEISGIRIYDDFAHHPTAIKLSCSAIRNKYSDKKFLVLSSWAQTQCHQVTIKKI